MAEHRLSLTGVRALVSILQSWYTLFTPTEATSIVLKGASVIAQLVKNPPAMQETPV